MRPLNAALTVVALIFAVAFVVERARMSRADERLAEQTAAADIVVSRLAGELAAAEAREHEMADSIARSRRERDILRQQMGVARSRTDSLLAAATRGDSLVPLALVGQIAHSYERQLAIVGEENKALLRETETLERMYRSADSGRAAMFDALLVQQALTKAWQAAAKPPLFSLRRFKPVVACVLGTSSACGVGVGYAF